MERDAKRLALCARRRNGEMTELAEGARLEIVCSAKSGTVGSNPTLSAMINDRTQRNADLQDKKNLRPN
jgi:hypothetical protein